MQVCLHYDGFVELRNSPSVVADSRARAARIAAAADGEMQPPVKTGGLRSRVHFPITGEYDALNSARDAGR